MAALTGERRTAQRDGTTLNLPVKAAVKCFAGGMAVFDQANGVVRPGVTATGQVPLGRFKATVDNSAGSDGDLNAEVSVGVFRWLNSTAGDLIAADDIGKLCYVVDDQTVALTDGTSTRSVAGRIVDVDAEGVWVDPNFRA